MGGPEVDISRTTDNGDGECVAEAMVNLANVKRYRMRRLAEGTMREEQNSYQSMLANAPHGHEIRRDTYISVHN